MAQLLLDVPIDKRKNLTRSDRLRILFQETKDVLLPLMHQHILEKVFTLEQNSSYSETIKKHMLYLLDNKPYFERATFVGLGIVSLGTAWEPFANVLIGEEFLYTSQVILDDIVDKQKIRMNRPTIHYLIGNDKAITIAKIFESEGYKLIQNGIADLPKDNQILIMNKIFEMMKDIYYAQFIDIENMNASIDDINLNNYLYFLRYTTPADIANCFYIGSIIGGGHQDLASQFYNFGLNLGMLMQIKDDFIDFSGMDTACKGILLDIKNNNKRIPVILAYNLLSEPDDRKFIKSILGKSTLDIRREEKIRSLIMSDNVIEKARELVEDIKTRAKDILLQLPIAKTEVKDILWNILESSEI